MSLAYTKLWHPTYCAMEQNVGAQNIITKLQQKMIIFQMRIGISSFLHNFFNQIRTLLLSFSITIIMIVVIYWIGTIFWQMSKFMSTEESLAPADYISKISFIMYMVFTYIERSYRKVWFEIFVGMCTKSLHYFS